MNFLKATSGPIEYDFKGVKYVFTPLTLRQCGELSHAWYEKERVKLLADMKDAGCSSKEILLALRELDWDAQKLSYGVSRCYTTGNLMDTLQKSLGAISLPVDLGVQGEIVNLAMKLWGWEKPPEKQMGESPAVSVTG